MRKKVRKKTRKPKQKSTDWSLGQPLDFPQRKNPSDTDRAAREAVEKEIGEPLTPQRPKREKK